MNKIIAVALTASALFISSCGPKAFVKGTYDQDVEKPNLMNDQWSETDMQKTVKDLVDSLIEHDSIKAAKKQPLVMVTKLQNKTSEQIDTQSIMDMFRVELTNRGKVGFVDKEAREDMAEEYNYQASGAVGGETKKGPGKQLGADYIINGRLDSIVQEVGKEKSVFYKVTMNMTNLSTGVIVWTNHKQMRKLFKKKSVGW